MPDHVSLHRTAYLQRGYVTARQAASHGFSRQLCNHYCRKGAWLRVARGVFRLQAVPERPGEELALVNLLASDPRGRPLGVVSHDTALHVHELLERPPATVHLSLPPGIDAPLPSYVRVHRRRIDLPWRVAGQPSYAPRPYPRSGARDGYEEGMLAASRVVAGRWNVASEPWRPRAAASGPRLMTDWRRMPLLAEDIEDRGPFRVTEPLRSVLDCVLSSTGADLPEAVERGLARGALALDDLLAALDGLPLFPATRGFLAMLSAVRQRAVRVEREVVAVDLWWRAHRHHREKTVLLPQEGGTRPHLHPSAESDDAGLPAELACLAERTVGEALAAWAVDGPAEGVEDPAASDDDAPTDGAEAASDNAVSDNAVSDDAVSDDAGTPEPRANDSE